MQTWHVAFVGREDHEMPFNISTEHARFCAAKAVFTCSSDSQLLNTPEKGQPAKLDLFLQVEEASSGRAADPASTLLNLCAVLSELGRHGAALEQARAAVAILQEEVRGRWRSRAQRGPLCGMFFMSGSNDGFR